MNPLFDLPEDRTGDDRRATCIRQDPLLRVGTPARDIFEKNNQMSIEVKFKIYTDLEVDMNAPNQSTPKVGAGKKAPKSAKLNLIDSKAINSHYLEIKTCPFGKSLNEFKEQVAEACEVYEPGMKKIILNSSFSPDLKWKANVGRSKSVLNDYEQWQLFVDALEKSTKKSGVVSIENENVQVKAKDGSKLIAMANGGGVDDQELEESKQERELQTLANQIFSQHAIDKSTGGPGKLLTTPWDPTFQYQLVYPAAWIWAKGVAANIATVDIPPNTSEFWYEIKKTRWIHPDMGVDHRVQLRLQGRPRGSQGINSNTTHVGVGGSGLKDSSGLLHSSSMPEMKPNLEQLGEKHNASGPSDLIDVKPNLKKMKVEALPNNTIDNPIYVSSEFESDWDSSNESSNVSIEIENPSTSHSVALELFLVDCEIASDDDATRTFLRDAGIKSWTDLIPSLQLTESTLTAKGMDRQIANRLMSEAQARFNKWNIDVTENLFPS
ncbi:uncharacterized protein MELLADRAFT_95375 [Melampsora larici-populina 98AG31]|uniref:Uncharacterized protein n=1 Tax=Melampsora larici-populina (strain 98AG31 / pathotype 3-4-7) TaxID=747676 RepID=F4RCB0_MELLP|nr:uncharacterized protein MELLADRAFT_95375 [Melampsora larici-populina 98AG31]EGG09864.1 hypothetical protein MELLADRAFT_95375 [Melampsora larici-populina 98AG31]